MSCLNSPDTFFRDDTFGQLAKAYSDGFLVNLRVCVHVLVCDKFILRIRGITMLVMNLKYMFTEDKLKLAPKRASKNYKSLHYFSYVFRKPSFYFPSRSA